MPAMKSTVSAINTAATISRHQRPSDVICQQLTARLGVVRAIGQIVLPVQFLPDSQNTHLFSLLLFVN